MIKKTLIITFLLSVSSALFAQEFLTGLRSNPAIKANKNSQIPLKSRGELQLPILDDFSYRGTIYPNDSIWADRNVYINSSYCINPPTVGVATLDALNDTGAVYPQATPTPFIADYLTSQPIRLDLASANDSVYLSFFYQPQGVADAPSINDSLAVDFYNPVDSIWNNVWKTAGLTLDAFKTTYNRYFRQVLIPVIKPQYLNKGFRFRFRNYASIAPPSITSWQSNVDEWNIDYVYLNKGRSKSDTVYQDITFVDPAPTFLKNYQKIPATHFTNADLTDKFELKESNLNNILTNMNYRYVVQEENGPYNYTKSGGVFDILPFITNGYHNYPLHATPAVDFTLPSFGSNDSVVFNVTHIISSNGWTDKNPINDTIVHRQEFYNSYAHDDGTAENGYGLWGNGAKLAYAFKLNKPDTLGGVEMFFNETLSDPHYKYFYLMVWSSINPEILMYKSKRIRPEFEGGINAFHIYQIEDTNLFVSGTIYVGWLQDTDDNLNVGYDRNTNSYTQTYFNVDGSWVNSAYDGSLMIRPLMGKSWQRKKAADTPGSPSDHFTYTVYPNPATDNDIALRFPSNYNTEENRESIIVEMFDNIGRMVINQPLPTRVNEFNDPLLDISAMCKGVYYIRLANYHTNEFATNKLVITR